VGPFILLCKSKIKKVKSEGKM